MLFVEMGVAGEIAFENAELNPTTLAARHEDVDWVPGVDDDDVADERRMEVETDVQRRLAFTA